MFFPEHFKNLIALFVFNLQMCKTDKSPRKDGDFTYRCPNLTNDASNKTYRSTESKETKTVI